MKSYQTEEAVKGLVDKVTASEVTVQQWQKVLDARDISFNDVQRSNHFGEDLRNLHNLLKHSILKFSSSVKVLGNLHYLFCLSHSVFMSGLLSI